MQAKETFLLQRAPKTAAQFGVSWFYPNTYSVGMFGLGYQLVWSLLEQDPDFLVRRGFTDTQEPGTEASDLFGFTLAWELDYINVLSILKANGVPENVSERGESDPIVFGGGPVLSANPEPFWEIFDVVMLGDAEATVPAFLQRWKELDPAKSRQEKLLELAQAPGLYVPSLYRADYESPLGPIRAIEPLASSVPPHLAKQLFMPPPEYVAHSVILSPDTVWGNIFLVEVVRSCPQECRFCLASFLTRPFRATKVDALLQAIDLGLAHTKNIGLLGPSVTEHPQFDEIAQRLMEKGNARISVASVRADSLNEHILSALKKLGQRSVTIAIESGSERLRTVMKKNLTETEIKNAVDLIEKSGLESVKFYGIAGLPHETQEDLDETVRLLTELKKRHKRLRFVFGISSFVPKAQTPFQWDGRDRKSGEKIEYIRKRLAKVGIEVRPESHNWSDIQSLISRGDRRLAPILWQVAKTGGNVGAWKRALKQNSAQCPGLDYYAFRNIQTQEPLPWTHLVEQTRTSYLEKHNIQAQEAADLPVVLS